jgi:hypothetical protein
MNFYIDEIASIREIRIAKYECFGWRLPDLLPNAVKPPRIPEPNVSTTGMCRHGSQETSEESSASSSQLHETDVNQRILHPEYNITINKNDRGGGIVPNQTKIIDPASPLTVRRSSIRNLRSKSIVNKKTFEDSSFSRQQLATLINPDSPHRRQLEIILNLDSESKSQTPAKVTTSGRQSKKSASSSRSIKHLSDFRTRSQDDSTTQVDINHKGLSTFVESALSIEHDPDRELEEPRGRFLQTATELGSKHRVLQADARRLHTDINTLHRDFQVGLNGTIKTEKSVSLRWRNE